jgi:hypothetical protein
LGIFKKIKKLDSSPSNYKNRFKGILSTCRNFQSLLIEMRVFEKNQKRVNSPKFRKIFDWYITKAILFKL